jgi:uncharacterized membrane protein HdeD (DUF308 family)
MHLERNLNPALGKLYIASGLILIAASLLAFRLLGTGLTIIVVACGTLSILSGYFRH